MARPRLAELFILLTMTLGLASGCTGGATGPGDMPWGPGVSTPGTRLEFVEVERYTATPSHNPGGFRLGSTVVRYRLRASGLARDVDYELWLKSSFQPAVRTRFRMRVQDNGEVLGSDGLVMDFVAGNHRRGEPYSAGLVLPDGSVRVMAVAYPLPLQAQSGTCRLALELLTPDGLRYGGIAEGFRPGSAIETILEAEGHVTRSRVAIDQNGRAGVILAPAGNASHGTYTMIGPDCRLRLEFPLGRASVTEQ